MRKRRLTRVGWGALSVAVLAAGCGGSDDDSDGGDGGDATGDGTAAEVSYTDERPADWDENGELTIAYSFPPVSLDPVAPAQFETYLQPVYDRLTEMTDEGEILPRLAESWEFPDESTMVMELRDDVTFHDGTPFNAEAVMVNLDRSRLTETSNLRAVLAGIESIEVVDEFTVQLNLDRGGAELPAVFSRLAGMMISPQVIEEDPDSITQGAGGSGSYILEDFSPNESVSYSPNPDHWNQREGLLSSLTILGITVGEQRLNALRAGDVDMIQVTGADVSSVAGEIESGALEGRVVDLTASQNVIVLRSTMEPFDDPLVREAVARAIDKEAIGEGLYQGSCTPADQFFPEDHPAHDESLNGRFAYDLEEAQDLLAEAGVESPTVVLDHFELYQAPAVALQEMLNEAGFEVELNMLNANELSFGDGDRQAYTGAMYGILDPSQVATNFLLGGTFAALDDPDGEIADLVTAASDPTASEEDRAAAYHEIWEAAYGTNIVIPICTAQQAWVHTGGVANAADLRYTFLGTPDASSLYVAEG